MFTYLVQADLGSGHVKIGKSIDPERRLKVMQSGSPIKLKIVAVLEGDFEKEYHDRFKHLKVHGEWFEAHQDIFEAFGLSRVSAKCLEASTSEITMVEWTGGTVLSPYSGTEAVKHLSDRWTPEGHTYCDACSAAIQRCVDIQNVLDVDHKQIKVRLDRASQNQVEGCACPGAVWNRLGYILEYAEEHVAKMAINDDLLEITLELKVVNTNERNLLYRSLLLIQEDFIYLASCSKRKMWNIKIDAVGQYVDDKTL